MKKLLLAKIVNTYSDRNYWNRWISTTHEVVQQVTDKLNNLKQQPQSKPILDRFFKALQNNIQGMPPSEEDAIEMLALHYVSKPVFDHLFHTTSPLSDALNAVIHDLKPYGLTEELERLQPLFWQAQLSAKDAPSNAAKQKILIHFYENFFRKTIPRKVQSLGIAYSPIEAVDYILHAVQDLLKQHWPKQPNGKPTTLGSKGVQIIEPFAGTGTFLARLIADKSLISDDELDFKYTREIFGNEILPLAYYAAQANIASAFEERTGKRQAFPNLWLGDTFLAYETANQKQPAFAFPGFEENAKILENQKQSKIRVIIGNPPWSAGAKNVGDDTQQNIYEIVRKRIEETYVKVKLKDTHIKRALYDYYVHAIRWASDRIGDPKSDDNDGIFAFITNGGYIDSKSGAGLRKCLIKEFDYIYVFNLRGNARNFADAKAEGQTFFKDSMAGVSLLICCRKPKTNRRQRDGVLSYVQVADGLTRYQKKQELRRAARFGGWKGKSVLKESNFKRIKPDEKGDWIRQVDSSFQTMIPLYGDEGNRVFLSRSFGIASRRDWWVYDFDKAELEARVWRMMEFFNQQPKDKQEFYGDEKQFNWSTNAINQLRRGFKMEHDPEKVVTASFRPFQKMHFYFCESVIHSSYTQHRIFPHGKSNQSICLSHHDALFSCLITDCVPDSSFASVHTQTLPRFVYSKDGERVSNINPIAIREFNQAMGLKGEDDFVNADGLFFYVYGFLHSEKWRKKWEITLRKEAARIDLPKDLAEFQRIAKLGKRLAELHLNYERIAPLELDVAEANGFERENPAHYEVEKMRWGGKRPNLDKTVIHFNRWLTIRGIPMEVHNYRLGARSALEWIVDRYKIKIDKRSQIRKNPNAWQSGKYTFDLIPKICSLSLKTREITNYE